MTPAYPVSPITPPSPVAPLRPQGAAAAGGFQSVMASALETVNGLQKSAGAAIEQFLSGEGGEIHQIALAQQKAQLSFELFLQARNKVVQAYQEIMRMPL